jgi:predicted Holliday junction resolvase-like endonuclease
MRLGFVVVPALILLSGCMVSTAAKVVTAPVKVASKTVDVMTTSQKEADLKRGRKARKAEERARKEARKQEKARRKAERE